MFKPSNLPQEATKIVRITPEMHRKLRIYAWSHDLHVDEAMERILQTVLSKIPNAIPLVEMKE